MNTFDLGHGRLKGRTQIRIGTQGIALRGGDKGMPQQFGDTFDGHALVRQPPRKSMTQLMTGDGDAGGGSVTLQPVLDTVLCQPAPMLIQEEMVVSASGAHCQPGSHLGIPQWGDPDHSSRSPLPRTRN